VCTKIGNLYIKTTNLTYDDCDLYIEGAGTLYTMNAIPVEEDGRLRIRRSRPLQCKFLPVKGNGSKETFRSPHVLIQERKNFVRTAAELRPCRSLLSIALSLPGLSWAR
jgi:hypothetical protein